MDDQHAESVFDWARLNWRDKILKGLVEAPLTESQRRVFLELIDSFDTSEDGAA